MTVSQRLMCLAGILGFAAFAGLIPWLGKTSIGIKFGASVVAGTWPGWTVLVLTFVALGLVGVALDGKKRFVSSQLPPLAAFGLNQVAAGGLFLMMLGGSGLSRITGEKYWPVSTLAAGLAMYAAIVFLTHRISYRTLPRVPWSIRMRKGFQLFSNAFALVGLVLVIYIFSVNVWLDVSVLDAKEILANCKDISLIGILTAQVVYGLREFLRSDDVLVLDESMVAAS